MALQRLLAVKRSIPSWMELLYNKYMYAYVVLSDVKSKKKKEKYARLCQEMRLKENKANYIY